MAGAEFDQRALHPAQRPADFGDLGAQVETQVERHLVVAAAGGVQLRPRRADAGGERRLDVHVDVFQFGPELELSPANLLPDLPQAGLDLRALFLREQARRRQGRGVRDAAFDVVGVEPPVEGDGFAVGAQLRVRCLLKTPGPHGCREHSRTPADGDLRDHRIGSRYLWTACARGSGVSASSDVPDQPRQAGQRNPVCFIHSR